MVGSAYLVLTLFEFRSYSDSYTDRFSTCNSPSETLVSLPLIYDLYSFTELRISLGLVAASLSAYLLLQLSQVVRLFVLEASISIDLPLRGYSVIRSRLLLRF